MALQIKLSPSGRRIAFTVCTDAGGETHRGVVRELPLGCALVWDLAEVDTIVSLEWLGEDAVLFTVPDASGRPHKVQSLVFRVNTARLRHGMILR